MFSPGVTTVSLLILSLLWVGAILSHLILLQILFTKNLLSKLRLPFAGSRPPMVTILLTQMTLADLFCLLFSVPFIAENNFNSENWIFGVFICKTAPFINSMANVIDFFSLLGLLLLAHDLVLKSHRPPTSPEKFTFVLTLIWTVALVASLPMLFFLTVQHFEYVKELSDDEVDALWQDLEMPEPIGGSSNFTTSRSPFSSTTSTNSPSPKEVKVVARFCLVGDQYLHIVLNENYELLNMLQHLLPLLSLAIISLKIFFFSNGSLTSSFSSSSSSKQTSVLISDRERSFAAAISWASLAVVLLWTPFLSLHIIFTFFGAYITHSVYLFWHLAQIASMLAVFAKPAIYCAADGHFRALFKEVLCDLLGLSRKLEPLSIVGIVGGGGDDGGDDTDEQLRFAKLEDTVEIV